MADESKQQQKSAGPELELRENRAPFYEDEPQRAETPQQERRAEDNRAIYLIEREAIRLRRYRWEQYAAAQPRTAAGTAESRVVPQDNELFEVYERPPSPQQAEAREKPLPRLWQWIVSRFKDIVSLIRKKEE
jgi:hypothetical protein